MRAVSLAVQTASVLSDNVLGSPDLIARNCQNIWGFEDDKVMLLFPVLSGETHNVMSFMAVQFFLVISLRHAKFYLRNQ